MKRILIVGAGGFGRELFHWLAQHVDCGKEWVIGGFLDDRPEALNGYAYAPGIIGSIKDYVPSEGDLLVCAVALPRSKKMIVDALVARGATFMTYVHPGAVLGGNVILATGTVICPGVVIGSDARIGAFITVNLGTNIGQGVSVGDYVTLNSHCEVGATSKVEEGAFFGSHALVLPQTHVGAWSIVGAGAVAIATVQSGSSVFGNPARTFLRR